MNRLPQQTGRGMVRIKDGERQDDNASAIFLNKFTGVRMPRPFRLSMYH